MTQERGGGARRQETVEIKISCVHNMAINIPFVTYSLMKGVNEIDTN
jgi:hypothetical protein